MAVVIARPTYAPAPDGGKSYKITFPIEQVRLYAYFFFITLCGLAMLLFNILVKPIIAAGAPEGTPTERLGCGFFNRVSVIYYPSLPNRFVVGDDMVACTQYVRTHIHGIDSILLMLCDCFLLFAFMLR